MTRRLVVNADDLGLTPAVNDGVFDAHDHGILTSASLFANAPATVDAIARAHRRPALGIGVHLALVDGVPMLPPNRVPTLIAHDGRFHTSWRLFIVACLQGRVALAEVARELEAQIDRLRSEGIHLTHLDAHKHVHAYPPIFEIVAGLARRFAIPTVRVPYERWSPIYGDAAQRRTARRQLLVNAAMLPWARRDRAIAEKYGINVPDFIGRIHTGVLTLESIVQPLRRLRPGVTELMVHPGYVDAALRAMPTRLMRSRVEEVRLLSSLLVKYVVSDEAIQLVRHDLSGSHSSFTGRLRHAS
ncbi:MAG TPA: ChbG/HpnK family deacetylase [Vicinamibacterales bacterium]|nr:ChbG/HpnK family deacetylase [Vicinamibacterales bacterium]